MSEDSQRFELHVVRQGETTCVALLGDFDIVGVERLEEELRRAEKETTQTTRATLDLGGLTFIDATGRADGSVPVRL